MVEGIGCVLAGMWGSGSGSTSYSENIGIIGATKVRQFSFTSVFRKKENNIVLYKYNRYKFKHINVQQ